MQATISLDDFIIAMVGKDVHDDMVREIFGKKTDAELLAELDDEVIDEIDEIYGEE